MEGSPFDGAQWTRGSDDEVRAVLDQELARLSRSDPFAALALGLDVSGQDSPSSSEAFPDDSAVRAAFLKATKALHPNRFARRDAAIRRVANEVYLAVKDAYESIKTESDRAATRAKLKNRGAAPHDTRENRAAGASGHERMESESLGAAGSARKDTAGRARGSRRTPNAADRLRAARRRRGSRRRTSRATGAGPEDIQKRLIEQQEADERAFALAKKHALQGEASAAIEEFQRLAVANTEEKRYRQWLYYTRGCAARESGDVAKARAELRRSLRLNSEFALAREALDELGDKGDNEPTRGLLSRLFRKPS